MKVFVRSVVFLALVSASFALSATLEDFSDDAGLVSTGKSGVQLPTITFPCSRIPDVCTNMQHGFNLGKPSQLTRITDPQQIARNRYNSGCRNLPKVPGYNCDEYPFASSKQGGKGAVIMNVPVRENSIQGGLLAAFYKNNNIGDGDSYNVKLG